MKVTFWSQTNFSHKLLVKLSSSEVLCTLGSKTGEGGREGGRLWGTLQAFFFKNKMTDLSLPVLPAND